MNNLLELARLKKKITNNKVSFMVAFIIFF